MAEELHFGRAAERLNVAQPAPSRTITELEAYLGVRLLERTTRSVTLTDAGGSLLRDARVELDAMVAADRRARHFGKPELTLRLALKADRDSAMLARIIAKYESGPAAIPVELVMDSVCAPGAAVREGRADVALVQTPFIKEGLEIEELLHEPWMLAVAAADPLAARPSFRLEDFAGRRFPTGRLVDPAELLAQANNEQPRPGQPVQHMQPEGMDFGHPRGANRLTDAPAYSQPTPSPSRSRWRP